MFQYKAYTQSYTDSYLKNVIKHYKLKFEKYNIIYTINVQGKTLSTNAINNLQLVGKTHNKLRESGSTRAQKGS